MDNNMCVEHDMSIGHADFWRLFPNIDSPSVVDAIGDQLGGQDVCFGWRGGEIRVQLSDEQIRRIASLRLPRTHVCLHFTGLADADVDYFVAQFYRRFQRAGG